MGAHFKTRLSTKGQMILPKAARDLKGWTAGAELILEERPEGLLIRKAKLFPEKTIDEVAGKLKHEGAAVSIEQMNEGVLEFARQRWLKKHACD